MIRVKFVEAKADEFEQAINHAIADIEDNGSVIDVQFTAIHMSINKNALITYELKPTH